MQIERITAKGQLVQLTFMYAAAAANLTNVALTVSRVAGAVNLSDGYTMPFPFEITGVSARVSTAHARTAGTLTVEPLLNGVATGLTASLNATNTEGNSAILPRSSKAGVTNGKVGCRITTDAAWLPITADVEVTVWVLLYIEGI